MILPFYFFCHLQFGQEKYKIALPNINKEVHKNFNKQNNDKCIKFHTIY